MDQNGWIKLYRSLASKGFYKKSDYVHLWIHLLIKADHTGKQEIMFAGEPYKLKAGEFSTGRKMLSKETGIHESKIQRILNYFEKIEHQIEQRTDRQCRLITILNWHEYQNLNNDLNNDRTTSEQRVNTKQEFKNNKNSRNIKTVPEKSAELSPADIASRFFSAYADTKLQGENYRKYSNQLGAELKTFVDYWTEPTKSGKRQRWETEKTWELGRRISYWMNKKNNIVTNGRPKPMTEAERNKKRLAEILEGLPEE